jgi:hypothetical protein
LHRPIEKGAVSTLRGVAVFSKGGAKVQVLLTPFKVVLTPNVTTFDHIDSKCILGAKRA